MVFDKIEIAKLKEPSNVEHTFSFNVLRRDIDFNNHMHNLYYLLYSYEAIPKEVYEKGNVYCATKFAVDAISQGMRIDLLRHNIKVTSINPGAAETEFSLVRFKGDEGTAKQIYDGLTPLTGDDVAEVIYYCASLPPHVCINDLSITCLQQANTIYFNRKLNS